MPPIDGFEHVSDWFFSIGPSDISYQEIKAWSDVTKTRLSPWHAEILHKMGSAYTNQLLKSKQRHTPAPYGDIKQMRVGVASKLKALRNG